MLKNHLIIICVFLIGSLASCSTQRAITVSPNPTTLQTKDRKVVEERMVIYEAFLTLVVQEPDSLRQPITDLAKKYDGYLVRFSPEYASIRIKSESLNEALAEFESLGKVKNKRVTGEDVTEFYHDAQIRLENAEKTRKRFLELLDKAQNVEEILKIEKELARINEQIELLKGKIKSLDQKNTYSLIEIDIQKKVKLGPLGYVTYGVFKGISWLFVRK